MRRDIAEADDTVDQYGEVFKFMMKKRGITALSGLVKTFAEAEDEKYAMYQYIQVCRTTRRGDKAA